MAIFDRLFGRHKEEPVAVKPRPTAPAGSTTPAVPLDDAPRISLHLLFPNDLALDAFVLTKRLCAFHPALNIATVELDHSKMRAGTPTGKARWGMHVVEFCGSNTPLDPSIVEMCVARSHYDGVAKQEARNHQAHLLVTYAGTHPSPLERYVAVTAVAGTLGSTGAVAVLNENARCSLPIEDILPSQIKGDRLEYLKSMPIPDLYAGFAELDVAGQRGVWMRTYGCQLLRLPNLAMLARDRSEYHRVRQIFARVFDRLLESQKRLEAGATMPVAGGVTVAFRSSTPAEFFLHDPTDIFIVEEVGER